MVRRGLISQFFICIFVDSKAMRSQTDSHIQTKNTKLGSVAMTAEQKQGRSWEKSRLMKQKPLWATAAIAIFNINGKTI